MKTKALALSLAAAMLLAGCGQVTDTGANIPDNTKGNESNGNSAVTTDTQDSAEENGGSTEPTDPAFEEYKDNILSEPFGFELYNDGHTDTWEKRYAVAALMLEAIAQPGTEFDPADASIGDMDLNAKETEGFMTWLKFENDVTFKVGDATRTGSMLMVVEDDGHYYFDIGNGENDGGMTIFDKSYIPKILEAASAEVPDDDLENRTAPTTAIEEVYEDDDFSKADLLIMTGDSESVEITDNDDKNAIIKAVLIELTGTFIESDEVWLDQHKYMGKESSVFLMFDFGEPTNIGVGNDIVQGVYVVALTGNDEDGYLIQVDNKTVYELDPEVIQQIRLRACD